MEDARVTNPPLDAVRRSRRVRKLPPQPLAQTEGGGGGTASQMKRARRQEEESPKEVSHEGDDCNVGGRVNPKANASVVDLAGGEEHEIGETICEIPEASVSSLDLRSGATGGSGVRASENSAEEQEAHPCLFIDTILDVVFKHIINQPGPRTVMAGDVRNIRLVCKTWATFITRLYRQTRPATIIQKYDQRHRRGLGLTSLTAFMKAMKSSQMIPMQNFTFCEPTFDPKNLKMFREFLRLRGSEVVVLTMSITCSIAERIMLNLENLPTLEMKKLKTLDLQMVEYHDRKFEPHGLVKLAELLLNAANNLHVLKVGYEDMGVLTELYQQRNDAVVQHLSLVIARRMPRTVKKLELFMKMDEAALNKLEEMQAKLEVITLWVAPGLGRRGIYKFLQSQASTLKDLQFFDMNDNGGPLVELPRLDELVNLGATVSVTSPTHFAETFPKLHSLKMNSENAISTLLSTVQIPSGSLKVLDMTRWGFLFICPASVVKIVAQSFPCLAELHIGVQEDQKETMEEVFKYLDSLESLHISFFDFNQTANWMDSLLSGIPEADCNRISRLQDFETVNWNELRRQPSMVNLKKLRTLEMKQYYGRSRIEFTDISAHSVFLEMKNLREIKKADAATQL